MTTSRSGKEVPLLLVIDTTGPTLSLGLDDGRRLRRASRTMPAKHDRHLWPLLDRLLARSGRSLTDIELVAAARGPGRFTGVRIGLAFATILAKSLGRPAVGPTTLEALAHAAGEGLPSGTRRAALTPAVRFCFTWACQVRQHSNVSVSWEYFR